MTSQTTINQIEALPGVTSASLWNKVPGKERVYIKTEKQNGGAAWNGGVGYTTLYIDIPGKRLVAAGEAGAATRRALACCRAGAGCCPKPSLSVSTDWARPRPSASCACWLRCRATCTTLRWPVLGSPPPAPVRCELRGASARCVL